MCAHFLVACGISENLDHFMKTAQPGGIWHHVCGLAPPPPPPHQHVEIQDNNYFVQKYFASEGFKKLCKCQLLKLSYLFY